MNKGAVPSSAIARVDAEFENSVGASPIIWHSMDSAPKTGYPIQHVRLLMESGAIVKDAHWAHGGGEDQPIFGPAWFSPCLREDGTLSCYKEVIGIAKAWAPIE